MCSVTNVALQCSGFIFGWHDQQYDFVFYVDLAFVQITKINKSLVENLSEAAEAAFQNVFISFSLENSFWIVNLGPELQSLLKVKEDLS